MSMTMPEPRIQPLRDAPVLRWGILAPGGIATSFATALRAHTDQRIVAVGSRSAERSATFAERFGVDRSYASYEAVVQDPEVDVVYIASPHSEHARQALLAIAAGKHVLVEKPLAPTAAEAEMVVAAARTAGVFAMEAMWTRYLPHIDVLRQLLENGAIGEPVLVSADFGGAFPVDPTSRAYAPELAGGGLLDVGVYASSFVSMVAGTPRWVAVTGALTHTGVDGVATIVGRHAGGVQSIATSTIWSETAQAASVSGREGRIDAVGPFWKPGGVALTRGDDRAEWLDRSGIGGGDGLAYEAVALARYIAEGRTESPLHSLDETVAIIRTLDDARRTLGVTGV
ncbi:Gfo/Idh/MocA family oxidoreductase [Microbacteriaceae bacterium VKM Ac-2855]|nr:Gfo/Idh/MocA family oxidoreductase [Microbacteriaceae bacterium VKM Ac-2855]